jgi:hypothetical protein
MSKHITRTFYQNKLTENSQKKLMIFVTNNHLHKPMK